MRTRKLVAGLCLTLGSFVAFSAAASVAGALTTSKPPPEAPTQDESGKKLKEANRRCVELLYKGQDVADCQKAPSPILPATNELIWSIMSFTIVFVLLWKLAWPGLKKGLNARTERIRDDLEAAERARVEAEQAQAIYQSQLADAKNEAVRIIEDARQTADATRAERMRALDAEVSDMRRRAASDIEVAKGQALAELRGEVANIAIGAAEQVVEHNLDPETNRRLVENFIAQVGAGRG